MTFKTHYCIVCKKKHSEEDWRWTEVKIKGKKKFYCRHGIDCYGCKKIHYNDTGLTEVKYEDGKIIELCGKWFINSQPTPQQKMKNLSPQEVMSGVQYGMPEQKIFRKETLRDDHSVLQRQAIKELKEQLS